MANQIKLSMNEEWMALVMEMVPYIESSSVGDAVCAEIHSTQLIILSDQSLCIKNLLLNSACTSTQDSSESAQLESGIFCQSGLHRSQMIKTPLEPKQTEYISGYFPVTNRNPCWVRIPNGANVVASPSAIFQVFQLILFSVFPSQKLILFQLRSTRVDSLVYLRFKKNHPLRLNCR